MEEINNLFDPDKIKQARKRLKKEYKQKKKNLKDIEKTSSLIGEVFTRGFLTVYILHLLNNKPLYGNEILKVIVDRTENRWEPSSGGIYSILRKLEKKKFVEGKWEDPDKRTRRIYTINSEGKTELDRLIVTLQPKAENTLKVFLFIIEDLFGKGGKTNHENTVNSTLSSIKR